MGLIKRDEKLSEFTVERPRCFIDLPKTEICGAYLKLKSS